MFDAVMAVSADLDLPEVLSRVVRSACELVGARYGALDVLAPDGESVADFITHGVPTKDRAAIGDLSMRQGVLGVPIRIHRQVFGNLYLADKQGAMEFSGQDKEILTALAAAAAMAIDNARQYERSRWQRRWLETTADLTQLLLEGGDEVSAADLLAARVREFSEAATVVVALSEPGRGLRVTSVRHGGRAARVGAAGPVLGATTDPGGWGDLMAAREPLLVLSRPGAAHQDLAAEVCSLVPGAAPGPVVLLPITAADDDIGLLAVAWDVDAEARAAELLPLLAALAQQVGLALVASRGERARSLLELLEDRDRIARDMHDHVIQRLFATGLSLQSAARLAQHPTVRARLDEAVDALDEAIKDIRRTIFELHRYRATSQLAAEITTLVRSSSESLGFMPELTITGPLDQLPNDLQADVGAVVRESLANVARHAHATRVTVQVSSDEAVCVSVSDDGVGTPSDIARSGLDNLTKRAAFHGGSLVLRPVDPHGTTLTWTVPHAPHRGG